MKTFAKWAATIRIAWSKLLAYKLNLLLLVIGPMVVFFFVRYNLWRAVFEIPGVTEIQGYDVQAMLRYQGWVLVVSLLAQGSSSIQISEDIRHGRISAFLIYPFGFWQFHTAGFVAFLGLQSVIAASSIAALRVAGVLPALDLGALAVGLSFALLVGVVWFAVQFLLGLISFWLDETWVLRVMFSIVAQFLSGAMIPLEVFPDWLRGSLLWTPFPYLTWAPVRMLMGEYAGSPATAFAVLAIWLVVIGLLAALSWTRGLRLYTAAGM